MSPKCQGAAEAEDGGLGGELQLSYLRSFTKREKMKDWPEDWASKSKSQLEAEARASCSWWAPALLAWSVPPGIVFRNAQVKEEGGDAGKAQRTGPLKAKEQ